ncbi:hypothetical protein K3495_g14174 [Podosphaera aphanis]|nr:hypothetical protein K3495_g14174 [Podosphaera aphanis]
MKKRGYTRSIAASKSPLSPENLRKRYDFGRNHLHWEKEDWMRVLWTDESWVTDGRHTRCWITRKPDEVYDNTYVVGNFRRRIGWIFWGSFFGSEKGPCLFWEKEWGSITAERYCKRIVPVIHDTVSMRPDLVVMQDNAPSHSAARTKRELSERNIVPLEWPPFSPNISPVEHVWNMMKNYIQYKYSDVIERGRRTEEETRLIVREAWDRAVNEDDLKNLVDSTPQRIKAVYDAGGGHVKY